MGRQIIIAHILVCPAKTAKVSASSLHSKLELLMFQYSVSLCAVLAITKKDLL